MLAAGRTRLLACVLACLLAAPAYRFGLATAGASPFKDLLLPGVMDSLATGALLALDRPQATAPGWRWFHRWRAAVMLAGFAAFLAIQALLPHEGAPARALSRCFLDVTCLALVSLAMEPRPSRWLDWLAAPVSRHIGRISYGIYVFHNFVPALIDPYLWRLDTIGLPALRRLARFLLASAISIGIAEFSWRVLEQPAMRLKERFRFAKAPVLRD